ncbi:unnamed protein product, partial [Rotaria socialis]
NKREKCSTPIDQSTVRLLNRTLINIIDLIDFRFRWFICFIC